MLRIGACSDRLCTGMKILLDTSLNMLVPQFRVNMRKNEHDTIFESFFLTVNPRINPSVVLVMAEYPKTVGEKIYHVQVLEKCIYKASPPLA